MIGTTHTPEIQLNPEIQPQAKVWIYQASRFFTDQEIVKLEEECDDFIQKWHTHGTDLHAFYQIFFNRFVCLFVDEDTLGASGCSIDSSIHFIQSLERSFDISLMNRTDVAYLDSEGSIQFKNLNELKTAFKNGELTADTIVFNNLVGTKAKMESEWIVPASQSWHKRMLI